MFIRKQRKQIAGSGCNQGREGSVQKMFEFILKCRFSQRAFPTTRFYVFLSVTAQISKSTQTETPSWGRGFLSLLLYNVHSYKRNILGITQQKNIINISTTIVCM